MDKRFWFVVGSIIIVIILSIAWGLLLFFGPNDTPGTFTTFEFDETNVPTNIDSEEVPTPATSSDTQTPPEPAALRQLSTRDIVGYRTLTRGTNTPPTIRIIERGTGFVFDINSIDGSESPISEEPFRQVSEAWLSSSGDTILIREGHGDNAPITLGQYIASTSNYTFTELSGQIHDAYFSTDDTLLLSRVNGDILNVVSYNLTTGEETSQVVIPFREAHIDWRAYDSDFWYVFPRPSQHLNGAVYQVRNQNLQRLPLDGYGLFAFGNQSGVVATLRSETGTLQSQYLNFDTNDTTSIQIPIIPPKCTFDPLSSQTIYCGGRRSYPQSMPDMFLAGEYLGSDGLWQITATDGTAELLINLSQATNRDIVVVNPTTNQSGSEIYFTNQLDGSIWVYELF